MSGYKHATDRTDWTLIVECPNNTENDEHLTVEAEATHAKPSPEDAFPIETCPVCGAELTFIAQEKPSEVLE